MSRHGQWLEPRPSSTCKILCVDDDPFLGDVLLYALQRAGLRAELATSAADAMRALAADAPDLVVLNSQLPDGDGLALCGYIQVTHRIPVIMTTTCHSDATAVAAFASGADDFVTKPFNMQVLACRIRAVLRRAGTLAPSDPPSLRLGPGSFSAERQEVTGPLGRARLTPIESSILHLLLANQGQAFSATTIMERVWTVEGKGSTTGVKTHVRRLRQKLAATIGDLDVIQTLPGLGYVLRQGPSLLDMGQLPSHAGSARSAGANAFGGA